MPNVLIEAMMAGCTPVSTDCETGPRELLVNGKFGYLVKVNDIESISRGLSEALENPIKKNILDEAVELFSEEKIIESYSRYLNINFNNK
jgi:glycosyltransferase involved in cell wall biosynthesis